MDEVSTFLEVLDPDFKQLYSDRFEDNDWTTLEIISELMTKEDLDELVEDDNSHKTVIWEAIEKLRCDELNSAGFRSKWQEKLPETYYKHLKLEMIWKLIAGKEKDIYDFKPDKPITIAIIDSGVQRKHHAFTLSPFDLKQSNVLKGACFLEGNNRKGEEWIDTYGHGTLCASIAAGQRFKVKIGTKEYHNAIGVAPFANILPVKIMKNSKKTKDKYLPKALEWLIKYHDDENQRVDIISISLGTPKCTMKLQRVINEATSKGIIVVVCASNEGDEDQYNIQYPGRFGNVICVGAHGQFGRAPFSSSGREVDFLAPGEGVYGADSKALPNGVKKEDGTSLATPFVAGVCALVLAFAEKCGGSDLRSRISHTQIMKKILCRMTTTPGSHNEHTGYGNIQPFNLFKYGEKGFKAIVTNLQASLGTESCKAELWEGVKHKTSRPTLSKSIDVCKLQTDVKCPVINVFSFNNFFKRFDESIRSLLEDVGKKWDSFCYHPYIEIHTKMFGYRWDSRVMSIMCADEIISDTYKHKLEKMEASLRIKILEVIDMHDSFKKALGIAKNTVVELFKKMLKQDGEKSIIFQKELHSIVLTTWENDPIHQIMSLWILEVLSEECSHLESIHRLILPFYGSPEKHGIHKYLHLFHITSQIVIRECNAEDIINLFAALEQNNETKNHLIYLDSYPTYGNGEHINDDQLTREFANVGILYPCEEFHRKVILPKLKRSELICGPESKSSSTTELFVKHGIKYHQSRLGEINSLLGEYLANPLPYFHELRSFNRERRSLKTDQSKVTFAILGNGIVPYDVWDLPGDIIGLCNTVPKGMESSSDKTIAGKDSGVLGFTGILLEYLRKMPDNEMFHVQTDFVDVKVMDNKGYYCHDWVLQGLEWLHKNDETLNVDVILFPLQFKEFDPQLYASIQRAINGNASRGKIVIASPLRSTKRTTVYQHLGYPASYGNVLCAGACETSGKVCSFSPSGREIDFILEASDLKRNSKDTQGTIMGLEMANASLTTHVITLLAFARSLDGDLADALTNIAVMRYVLQQASTQSGHHEEDTGHGTIYLSELLSDEDGHRLKVLVDEISGDYHYQNQ